MSINDEKYLDKPEQWEELAARIRKCRVCGYDSEFYNVRVDEQSCVDRARVHVFSLAIRTKRVNPLGFHIARGWCLPVDALTHPSIRGVLEDPSIRKEIHNEPVDKHAAHNHGVDIRGARNTLGFLRWKCPWLINLPGRFKLKACMQTMLHTEPICEFEDVVSYQRLERITKTKHVTRTEKLCSCGVAGCRKRKGHNKTERAWTEEVEVVKEKLVDDEYPLETIVPGFRCRGCQTCQFRCDHWLTPPHERHPLLVDYAINDAVVALELAELADEAPDPAPWPYGGIGRPAFNQAVEEEVIKMEAVGIPVDVPFCTEMTKKAEDDEKKELDWLYRWWVVNGPDEWGPHQRERVDKVWSSPVKKVALFDAMGFPRSPIWKKGRVKPGKVKLDATALEWIGKNHPDAKQLTDHLLHLQRIRSSKKYLIKLRDSGGMVHPICGPAGDEDERAGAVTGRLGIKGEFEAQQMPSREEVDLYQLRKAVIA